MTFVNVDQRSGPHSAQVATTKLADRIHTELRTATAMSMSYYSLEVKIQLCNSFIIS